MVWRWIAVVSSVLVPALCAQPGRGPLPSGPLHDPQAVQHRMDDIRKRLEASPPSTAEQEELAAFVRTYLDQAGREIKEGRRFQAERLVDAADACWRPIDHLRHVAEAGPPGPPPAEDHLRQVYFRIRLSDFFMQQIPVPQPKRLRDLARTFYERALKAHEEGKANASEEYAKAADDLTHALEGLAQAYVSDISKLP
jgi:hypothetical protein